MGFNATGVGAMYVPGLLAEERFELRNNQVSKIPQNH